MGVKCCTYNIGLLLPVAGELQQPLCRRAGYINGHGIMLPESDVGSLVYATHEKSWRRLRRGACGVTHVFVDEVPARTRDVDDTFVPDIT